MFLLGMKTMRHHHKLKGFGSTPPTPPNLPIKVAALGESKGISPSLQKTLIRLTHKRPLDHKSADPGWAPLPRLPVHVTLRPHEDSSPSSPLPSVFPLSFLLLPLPPILTPLPPPFAFPFLFFETSECRRVQSLGAPRGPPEIQTEGGKIKNLCSAHGAGAISPHRWGRNA